MKYFFSKVLLCIVRTSDLPPVSVRNAFLFEKVSHPQKFRFDLPVLPLAQIPLYLSLTANFSGTPILSKLL